MHLVDPADQIRLASSAASSRRPITTSGGAQPGRIRCAAGRRESGRFLLEIDREPSAASLREIPEVDFSKSRIRRNPYAARVAREGLVVQIGRGRPRKLLEVGGTRPRSVRFSDVVWKQIEVVARARGLSVHAALREAILAWLGRAA